MKTRLLIALLLTGCAGQAQRASFEPPAAASSHEDLIGALPAELYRGDLAGDDRGPEDTASAYLDFVFLKNEPADQVPMRVALYEKAPTGLARTFVAATPFAPGDCRRGECRARIARIPKGFQISRESFGADRQRADYRFVAEGRDLRLIGKGFQARRPGGGEGKAGGCSLYFDYAKSRILRRNGERNETSPLPSAKPLYLLADHLRFESLSPAEICAAPAR